MSDKTREIVIEAYGRYDSDPRVNGPDDFDAFMDAVKPLMPDKELIVLTVDYMFGDEVATEVAEMLNDLVKYQETMNDRI